MLPVCRLTFNAGRSRCVPRWGATGKERTLPLLSATASRAEDGTVHLSLVNVSLNETEEVAADLSGLAVKNVSGEILTGKLISAMNTFEQPDLVKPEVFKGAKISKGKLVVKLPPMSVVVLALK